MTKNELILLITEALTDITDGVAAHDLMCETGLPLDRCKEIEDISDRCFASYQNNKGTDMNM